MSLFSRLFRRTPSGNPLQPAYAAAIATARAPHWYRAGVPDTIDGRFDMLIAIVALVEIELERRGRITETVRLTELFVEDMEGQARQIGVGDPVVSKHLGKMVSALGGRIGALRDASVSAKIDDAVDAWQAAVTRNITGAGPDVAARLKDVAARLAACDDAALVAGRWDTGAGDGASNAMPEAVNA